MTQTLESERQPGVTRQTLRGAWWMLSGTGRSVRGVGRGLGRGVRWIPELRYAQTWKRLFWRALVVALVLGVGYVVVTFVQVWWASTRDGGREADVALVLGAAQYDGQPSPVLERRLEQALELYQEGLVGKIVVTGGKQEGDRFTEAQAGAMYLQGHGVPDEDLLLEVQGTNSWESLAAAARFLQEMELTRVVLVTDGYHALRVRAIADELGLDASVSPSRQGGSPLQLVQETGAVAVGRVLGFSRMVRIDDRFGPRGYGGHASVVSQYAYSWSGTTDGM